KTHATTPEEEWIQTPWRDFPPGVILLGYSQERSQWAKHHDDDEIISVSFFPDGTVKPAHALRFTSVDLDEAVPHVLTILINPLTSAATVSAGEAELPETRDAAEFR